MGEVLSCRKVSSSSSSLKPLRNRSTIKANRSDHSGQLPPHQRQGQPYTVTENFIEERNRHLFHNRSGGNLDEQRNGNGHLPAVQNDELLSHFAELRQQLEHLKGVLEEMQIIDVEKDQLIERLTKALHSAQLPSTDVVTVGVPGNGNGDRNHNFNYNLNNKQPFGPVSAVIPNGVSSFDYYDEDLV